MLRFEALKIRVFSLLGISMSKNFKRNNIIYTREIGSDEKDLRQRWHRVKDYLPSDENEHWQKALKDFKRILRDSKMYPQR